MSLVTLLSDYGTSDYYVALLKAALYSHNDDLTIVDVSHDIARHDIMEASFYMNSIYNKFPVGTIHVVSVNSFYSEQSELIVFEREGYYFVGPNNGLFSLVFPDLSEDQVYSAEESIDVDTQYELLGYTVRRVLAGGPLGNIGPLVDTLDKKITLQPVITSEQIRATIVHIDQFGNVIVNINKVSFEKIRNGREYAIYYKSKDPIVALSQGYNQSQIGDVCAFFNTIGMLEIAINMGNAHELLNLNKNETIQINFY